MFHDNDVRRLAASRRWVVERSTRDEQSLSDMVVLEGNMKTKKNNTNRRTTQPDRQLNRNDETNHNGPRCRTTTEIACVCWDSWTFWSCGGDGRLGNCDEAVASLPLRSPPLLSVGRTNRLHARQQQRVLDGARNGGMPYPNDHG